MKPLLSLLLAVALAAIATAAGCIDTGSPLFADPVHAFAATPR